MPFSHLLELEKLAQLTQLLLHFLIQQPLSDQHRAQKTDEGRESKAAEHLSDHGRPALPAG